MPRKELTAVSKRSGRKSLVAFCRFPKEHWSHLHTTNPVESPFSSVRIRTDAARRFKKVANATAVVWKTLMVAQRRFRKLNTPRLCEEVFRGATYLNGVVDVTPQEARSQKEDAA